ncbi:MAG: InlB B-repeat-containing protein, partial [Candidatus Izemoplasmatales bacterium]|nr:InlB B-repeat-containing protein [Candidatus Izemoplasmatales bacterium]
TLENKLTPQNITNAFAYSWWLPFNIKAIEAGYHTTFIVIGDDYRLFAFGRNLYGVLSDGTQIDRHTPREISIFHNSIRIHVSGIGTGDGHTLFQSTNGRLFGVGRNFEGQIGDNTRIDRINPIRLFAPDYTITFDSQGGNAVDSITTYEGGPVTMPQDPVKPGFVFKGWFGSPNPPSFHTKVVYTVMPYQSVALYAVWSPDRYALIFRDSQNEIIQSTDYLINADLSAVIPPTAPEKTGYSFTGWSIDIPPTMPTQDVYIDAQYTKNSYTITFETNGGTSITPLVTPYQNWVFIQNTPSRVGYTFGGWFTDESLTIPYVDAHQPAYNFTLYAKWNGTQFQLIYRDHDQQILQSTTYNVGANLGSHVAPIPTRVGYTFTGWSQSVPSTMPSQDVTLTAQWTINQYTITFNSTGGSAVSSITQNYHSAITSPANPTRVGYTFTGWSPIVPTNMPAENLTLSAQWSINQYTITFNTNGGSAVASITQDYNSVVNTPINPTKEGYVFNGWSQSIPSTMPASHLEIQAYWILNTQDSGAFQTQTDAIHDLIDPSMIEGKNVEIIIRVEVKPQVNILPSEIDIVNQVVKDTLQIQNYGSVFINIEIILKEAGLDDVLIQELLEPLAITISIPQEYQGFRNYRVIRIHNGEAVVLETQYHHVDQTLTFLTDRFSTYVITYDLTSGFSIWWLLLLLLVPAGYFIYLQTKKIRLVKQEAHSSDHVEVSSSNEEKKEVVVYDEVMIHKVEERPQFLAFETVQNGEYLEVTKALEATSRVVEVSTGVLPKLINTENRFVSLSKKEAKQFKETSSHLDSYQLLTPGSYTDSGYFMEVDTNKKAVHNYIYTKKRLPPTSAVGHCWVRVEPRKIKTE